MRVQTENDVLRDPLAMAAFAPGTAEFCRAQDGHLAGVTTADAATGCWSTAPVQVPVDMDLVADVDSELSVPIHFRSIAWWPCSVLSVVVPLTAGVCLFSLWGFGIAWTHERIFGGLVHVFLVPTAVPPLEVFFAAAIILFVALQLMAASTLLCLPFLAFAAVRMRLVADRQRWSLRAAPGQRVWGVVLAALLHPIRGSTDDLLGMQVRSVLPARTVVPVKFCKPLPSSVLRLDHGQVQK